MYIQPVLSSLSWLGSRLNDKYVGSDYHPLHILGRPKLLLQHLCNLAQLLSNLQTDHAKLRHSLHGNPLHALQGCAWKICPPQLLC